MTFVEQGTQGAFRQTWRKGNPRSLLKTMMEANPQADQREIYKLYWDEVNDDKELLRDIVGYWLDHNYLALVRETVSRAPSTSTIRSTSKTSTETSTASKLKDRIRYETKIVLLDLIMPNDKPLAHCTGAECSKFGGWLFQLSKTVPGNRTVGQTLSEDQVYQLWQKAKNYKAK
jgi:hypothetical protein